MADNEKIVIGMVLFQGWELLDSQGPFTLLLKMAAASPDPSRYQFTTIADSTFNPQETTSHQPLVAEHTFASCPPLSVLILPGGIGTFLSSGDAALLAFLREQHANPRMQWLCSVCTGSSVFAAARILDDRHATSNKAIFDVMARYGGGKVHWEREARFIVDGNVVTASGVSAGVDMAFEVGREVFGESVVERIKREVKYVPLSHGEDPFAKILPPSNEWGAFRTSIFLHALAPVIVHSASNQAASPGLPFFRKQPRNILTVLLFPHFDALDVACVQESLVRLSSTYRFELVAVLPAESRNAIQVGGDSAASTGASHLREVLRVACDRLVDAETVMEEVFPWTKVEGAGRPIVFIPGVGQNSRASLDGKVGRKIWDAVKLASFKQSADGNVCFLGCGDEVCQALEQATGVTRSSAQMKGWERVENTWFAITGMKGSHSICAVEFLI
ncbi:class I glutamine amidotransferase-like protein [Chytriomyces sp. MP71]|nr:class I glutamine amidotransferase-like protein [Chytriomyces sp. MP71]